MGNNSSTPKSNDNIDYLNDFFGKQNDQTGDSYKKVLQTNSNADDNFNYRYYVSSSGNKLPYIITSDQYDSVSNSDGISEIEFIIQNDIISKPVVECYTVPKESYNHICIPNCPFCKKFINSNMYGGKSNMVDTSSSIDDNLDNSTSDLPKTKKKQHKKQNKNNSSSENSSESTSDNSESTSDNKDEDLDIEVSETSEDGIMLTSEITTSDLYKMQERIAMNEYTSESDDDHTENVRLALNMINNKNEYSNSSNNILDMFSESTPTNKKKFNENPKYK